MITFEHVSKRYGEVVAVEDLSLEFGEGEIVVLAGPSGCGKTTILKMINRLVEPSAGTILIDGRDSAQQDLTVLRRSIGYVIQQGGLFPHYTVADNVATVPRLLGWDRARVRKRVAELLDLVGLPVEEYGGRLPGELSGGERQRIGVARALGADPPILLMDEPFGAIDPVTRERLQDELLRLQGIVKKTIVFVTHDIDEAIKLADRVVLLERGGRLVQFASPPELLARPGSQFATNFLGAGHLVRRLGLVSVRACRLLPATDPPPCSIVEADASLRDALDALLRSDDGRVAVVDGDSVLGMLDADAIRLAAR